MEFFGFKNCMDYLLGRHWSIHFWQPFSNCKSHEECYVKYNTLLWSLAPQTEWVPYLFLQNIKKLVLALLQNYNNSLVIASIYLLWSLTLHNYLQKQMATISVRCSLFQGIPRCKPRSRYWLFLCNHCSVITDVSCLVFLIFWYLEITKLLTKITREKGNEEFQPWIKPCERHP